MDCCTGQEAWAIASCGLRCVAQDEVLLLIKMEAEEARPPFDILRLFNALYEEALQGLSVFLPCHDMGRRWVQGTG